jgi:hypothetical protein
MSLLSKVVIPVKTGIQKDIARHNFWIPTYVGMTKRLKNNTFNTKPRKKTGGSELLSDSPVSVACFADTCPG